LVVAEVVPATVASVRAARGRIAINVAHRDRLEAVAVGPIEILDPGDPDDRGRLIEALVESTEGATAVPSVDFYRSGGPGSIHRLLARAIERRGARPLALYAAENHNRAAEILCDAVAEASSGPPGGPAAFLNTVIGKMSGVVTGREEVARLGLEPIVPGLERAFLVEAFNRILVSRVEIPGFRRGIEVFEEKPDLLPFEEAKLYGHNATHALLAYLAKRAGVEMIAEARDVPGLVAFVRAAFLEESGGALIARHGGIDPLFTEAGYRAYADDLIERMLNPFLRDTVERVGRDPTRKLGWEDRLIGTIRVAMGEGVRCGRYAVGAAAALRAVRPDVTPAGAGAALGEVWGAGAGTLEERRKVSTAVGRGLAFLDEWERRGKGPIEDEYRVTEAKARS
ncbi:MAG: hypothetical protein JXP34_17550, partial [Planctomycetes bacterium]|nr:hypothetical protein [Planctomycetota bacterium]